MNQYTSNRGALWRCYATSPESKNYSPSLQGGLRAATFMLHAPPGGAGLLAWTPESGNAEKILTGIWRFDLPSNIHIGSVARAGL